MLVDEIKRHVTQAMKDGDAVAKAILRLALGEIQTAEARTNRALSDEEAVAVVRKLVKSNEETLVVTVAEDAKATLRREIEILSRVLPATLGVARIVELLAPVSDAIKSAKADGQATGVAVKHLKSSGADAAGTDVAAAVKQIRGA